MSPFDEIFVPDELAEAVSDRAWLEAMLDVERSLAGAEALAGVISADAAAAVVEACDPERYDIHELAVQGRAAGNPVEPLVRAIRAAVAPIGHDAVHWGATSQDVLDTAAMLVARRALGSVLEQLAAVAAASARLAREHRETVMAGRTLLQQAVPTTFGLKAAGWLVATVEARGGLLRAHRGLAVQLGGAAGTLASLGDKGPEVAELHAAQLGLATAPLPWHTNRVRVAELGAALAVAAGVAAKIGLDVALLQQTEVGEVRDPAGGGSSTMPQKRNPVSSTIAIACARQVTAQAAVLLGSLVAEHERALGGWHAEWDALSRALALTGGGTAAAARLLDGLEVDAARMRANLEPGTAAERISLVLTKRVGREQAHALLAEAARSDSFVDALRVHLSAHELETLLDPTGYLGSAGAFVDRALALYESGDDE
jgi:3-carboxy-cis,cis-muconate cycloisomerase